MFHVVPIFIHLTEMRALRNVEDVGGENLMGKVSLAPVTKLWNEWEIHCLILTSLALQVLLFFAAGMRRRSPSRFLSTVLWLAYLSADSVAIFVLGHLAVRANGPQHELILFWAPFLLVHLGGQDTITALSVQDNELWMRHLLGVVSQVAVAGYVVSKSSWPDRRLLAATVLVFLSGSFKYAGRTYCLYLARPANIRVQTLNILSDTLIDLKLAARQGDLPRTGRYCGMSRDDALQLLDDTFQMMFGKRDETSSFLNNEDAMEIMSVDAPLNQVESILLADDLPSILEQFQSTGACLGGAYEFVAGKLVECYESFYTKRPLLNFCEIGSIIIFPDLNPSSAADWYDWENVLWLVATIFQYFSTPIALLLFILAEKGRQVHSRADVTVSYILLVGAIILDVSSAYMSILSVARYKNIRDNRIKIAILRVANYIQPAWCRKQWSEKLAQYSMIKRYTMEDTRGMPSVGRRIGKHLAAWGVELLDPSLTHTQVTEDLKGFVLNKLILFGTSRQYKFAYFHGQLALQKWRRNGPGTAALYYSINDVKDFPTSVLIWHIATDICYYSGNSSKATADSDKSKKQMSRELSNYILYLVFKRGVMLTSNSQLVHNKVHDELKKILAGQQPQMVNLGEKEAVLKVFEGTKDGQPPSTVNGKQEQPVDTDNETSSHMKKLLNSTAEAIYSPVLPHASKVAQELMDIDEEADRWDLITAVWLEMLYYTAPRCGAVFHYQHLSTGGEFITHVLLLMRNLGPFLPGPDNPAP